jgi:hypothetical protein
MCPNVLLGYNFFIKIKALIVSIITISALVLNDGEKQKKLR